MNKTSAIMFASAAPLLGRPAGHLRGAVGLSAIVALAAAAIPHIASGVAAPLSRGNEVVLRLPPPTAPPTLLRDVDREDALSINATIPFSHEPNPPARAFKFRGDDAAYSRALHCLTEAIYYEAGSELPDGQRAVAQVVLNRVRHPAFSDGVCATVYHGSMRTTGCQFSFTCDGSMRRTPTVLGWARARGIAEQALTGAVFKPVGYATHYHADYVVPYWAPSLAKNAVLGTHIFYRWPGWWGQTAAFSTRHSGKEMDPRLLRNAALRRHGVRPEPPSWIGEDLVLEADPRVELISIIQFLAARSAPSEGATPYEKEVRRHFAAYFDHYAVQMYRQLSAGNSKFNADSSLQTLMHFSQPPKLESGDPVGRDLVSAAGGIRKLAGFISALRDFVKHTNFEAFLIEQEPLYVELQARARQPAVALVTSYERDTDTPVHTVRFILAPLLLPDSNTGGCYALEKRAPVAWVTVGLGDVSEQPFDKPAQIKKALATVSQSDCLRSPRSTLRRHPVRLTPST